jgi:hypothetical protein
MWLFGRQKEAARLWIEDFKTVAHIVTLAEASGTVLCKVISLCWISGGAKVLVCWGGNYSLCTH